MCECQVINSLPPEALEDLRQLYISAGWITPEDNGRFLVPVLKQSAVAVALFDGGKLVGFGRALSDNCSDVGGTNISGTVLPCGAAHLENMQNTGGTCFDYFPKEYGATNETGTYSYTSPCNEL